MAIALQNLAPRRPQGRISSTASGAASGASSSAGLASNRVPETFHAEPAVATMAVGARTTTSTASRSGSVLEPPMCLNDLIAKPAFTFLVRVQGHSLVQAGIIDGDLLVVDRSVKHRNNDFVVAAVQGELTVKRIEYRNGKVRLVSANPEYPPIDIIEDMKFEVLGVVTHVVHFMR